MAAKGLAGRVGEAMHAAYNANTFRQFLLKYFDKLSEDYAAPDFESLCLIVAHTFKKGRLLGELLDALCKDRAADPAFQQLKSEVQPLLTAGDPFEAVLLFEQRPLLDRQDLRALVRKLAVNLQPRLILIQGERETGKSQTAWFIRHIHETRGGFKLHWIDFETEFRWQDEPDRRVTALDLAQVIDGKLSLSYSFPVDSSGYVFKHQPFGNVFSQALNSDARAQELHVILLDSFSKRALDPGVFDLVDTLALTVARELSNVFLVLLDFDRKVPVQIPDPLVYREKTTPLRDLEHVAAFFTQVLKVAKGLADNPEQAMVAKAVAEATSGLDLQTLTSMGFLSERCSALASRIKAGTWAP